MQTQYRRNGVLFLVVTAVALAGAPAVQGQAYGLDQREANTSLLIDIGDSPLQAMRTVRAFPKLRFTQSLFLTHANDGSDRLFVLEKTGRIHVFPNDSDVEETTVFLNLSQVVNTRSEGGLLGLAFHPDFRNNGRVFVSYTTGNLISRISEFKISSDPNRLDAASERVVMAVDQPANNHNGGMIAFGPDGYLYIGFGDGGGGNDQFGHGQNPRTLLGNILRIDIDVDNGYGIPGDNPFVGNNDRWREEIWAWGFRNPWRFSFDRETGDLWTGDVGQRAWEEIDLVVKGGNYGWNTMEGFHCFSPSSGCDQSGLELPVIEYGRSEGRSITGGYVYRGQKLPSLYGAYLYGDYAIPTVWGLRYQDGKIVEQRVLVNGPAAISSFGEDEAGEIYIVGFNGIIYSLEETNPGAGDESVPQTISASGLYSDINNRTLSAGIIPYGVNAAFWSDNADKTRYMALPGTAQIGFSEQGNWAFPQRSVLVKNYYLEMEIGNAASKRLIETRFLVKQREGERWRGFSYAWRDDGSDADLLDGPLTKQFEIQDAAAPGGKRQQFWYYPGSNDCARCHTPESGYVLGLRTAQLNGEFEYPQARDNQLRTLNHIGLFDQNIGENNAQRPSFVNPYGDGDLEVRSRIYLDVNCASCHQPGGSGTSLFDLRAQTPLAQTNLLDVPPAIDNLDVINAKLIRPGAPDSSVIYLRMLDLFEFRMPPLGSTVVDAAGADLIRDWIVALGNTTGISRQYYLPAHIRLSVAAPNPLLGGAAKFQVQLQRSEDVQIAIFDVLGRQVRVLHAGLLHSGAHRFSWDGLTAEGIRAAAGLYFYGVLAESGKHFRRLNLLH